MPKIDFIQILLNILGHVRLHSKHSFSKIEKAYLACQRVKRKFWKNSLMGIFLSKLAFSIQNWPKMNKTDQKWPKMTKNDQKWPKMTKTVKMARNCHQVQIGSDLKPPWTSTWIRLIQFWTWTFFRNQNIEFGELKFWLWFLLTSVLKS